jgi:hypothetical protein
MCEYLVRVSTQVQIPIPPCGARPIPKAAFWIFQQGLEKRRNVLRSFSLSLGNFSQPLSVIERFAEEKGAAFSARTLHNRIAGLINEEIGKGD